MILQVLYKPVEPMPPSVPGAKVGHTKYEDILKNMDIFQKPNFSLTLLS